MAAHASHPRLLEFEASLRYRVNSLTERRRRREVEEREVPLKGPVKNSYSGLIPALGRQNDF